MSTTRVDDADIQFGGRRQGRCYSGPASRHGVPARTRRLIGLSARRLTTDHQVARRRRDLMAR